MRAILVIASIAFFMWGPIEHFIHDEDAQVIVGAAILYLTVYLALKWETER